jgi:hypothetical protein
VTEKRESPRESPLEKGGFYLSPLREGAGRLESLWPDDDDD